MAAIRSFDHVGITVEDLDTATAFFVSLGLVVEGRTFLEGEFVDTVIGMSDARAEIVMVRPPDGGTGLELSRFLRPPSTPGCPDALSNQLGLRSVLTMTTSGPSSSWSRRQSASAKTPDVTYWFSR